MGDKLADYPSLEEAEEILQEKLIMDRYSNYAPEVYHMTEARYKALLEEGYKPKAYFDKLCGKDIYEILGIE